MTMTEIVSPETGINHTTEIDHIVEKDCKTTIEMITKMITKMTTEITIEDDYRNDYRNDYRDDYRDDYRGDCRKKIIGISKTRNMRKHRDNYKNTYEDRYIDYCSTTYEDSHGDKYRDKYKDDSFDSDKGRSREKHCLHNTRKDIGLVSSNPKIKQYHGVLQQLSPDKLVAIRFILASSENFDDVDDLIAEWIEYVKNRKLRV